MKPIYKPKGRALEYSPDALALNIYTGCPHRCFYCFAPNVLKQDREKFHIHVEPRHGIINAVKRQLLNGYVDTTDDTGVKNRIELKGKLIHLCFTCDPYPCGYDTSPTREIIKAIKESGNHVQILTKSGGGDRDFDLLDSNDWYGITYTGGLNGIGCKNDYEIGAAPDNDRFLRLKFAKENGINTWVSCEPIIDIVGIYGSIVHNDFVDLYRIGKLNYHKSDINWGDFGRECERLCTEYGRNYYIKDDLRKAMATD